MQERATNAYLFSPAEAGAEQREQRHQQRVTPLSCGNRPGSNRKQSPQCVPGERYTAASYRRAITRACDVANRHAMRQAQQAGMKVQGRLVERWHPHQLYGSAACLSS